MTVGGGGRHSSRVYQEVRWWHRAPEPQLRVALCHAGRCMSVCPRVVRCVRAWCVAHLYTAADAQHREPETMWHAHAQYDHVRRAREPHDATRISITTRVNGPASASDASPAQFFARYAGTRACVEPTPTYARVLAEELVLERRELHQHRRRAKQRQQHRGQDASPSMHRVRRHSAHAATV